MDYDYLKYKKILIVDDEADLREMVTSILEQDGFKTIKTAGTVAEALKICRDWEPDLAILDVMLPDGNGFSLFEQMRTFTEVPVLFLTARGEDEDKLKGLGLGADDYMVKPFLPKELSLRIGSHRKIKSLFGKFLLSFGSESELLERDFSHRLQDIEKEMEEQRKRENEEYKEVNYKD